MSPKVIESVVEAYLDTEDSPEISNPIHSTEIAKVYGFDGPLVGGVTVWGWATDAILEALGEAWLEEGWAEYSFRQPVFPGDLLHIKLTQNINLKTHLDGCSWEVEITNQSGVKCVIGQVGTGEVSWAGEFVRPSRMTPVSSPNRDYLTLSSTQIGRSWYPLKENFNQSLATEFISAKQHTKNPLFLASRSKKTIAHPSWTAGWAERLMRHSFDIPSSMHTKSRIKHHAVIPVGTDVIGGAYVVDIYESKAHHFVNFDVLLQANSGDDIAQIRHWTIFKIATPEERMALS